MARAAAEAFAAGRADCEVDDPVADLPESDWSAWATAAPSPVTTAVPIPSATARAPILPTWEPGPTNLSGLTTDDISDLPNLSDTSEYSSERSRSELNLGV